MTKDLADELERLAKALFDEPDAARRIYRSVALSLWVENNLPRIISALRREEPASLTREGEPVAWRRRGKNLRWEYLDDGSSSVVVSEWAPLYTRPVACPDRPALDVPALQREVAGIIVRDVLQEDFDDLVEGYLDEIMRASLRIIRLPGYAAVAPG